VPGRNILTWVAAEFPTLAMVKRFPSCRKARVVAHDVRGHGQSSQASSGNNMNGYADFWPASSGPVLARNFRVAHYWASERLIRRVLEF
jgi:hypothetical protein